jgi:hypothetical protein
MPEEATNPFDESSYSNSLNNTSEPTELPSEPTVIDPVIDPTPAAVPEPAKVDESPVVVKVDEPPVVADPVVEEFKWDNEMARNIYDGLIKGNISDVADIIYEQKVLSEIDKMDESDILKLKMAYDFPDLTPREIEEEFDSKYAIDKDFDETLMSEEEIVSKKKQFEKQEKAIAREMKKDVREAKDHLQSLKQDISFPDILSQFQQSKPQEVNTEEIVNKYLTEQQEEQAKAYQQSREVFEKSIDDGLQSFEGFSANYKDEDVQFDGKYSLTQEDKTTLKDTMKAFDLESFYGSRYYKDGKYDTKQLAEDIYFLQNKDKVVNSMVTQAVSKAKTDILKGMKNIDYSNSPRPSAAMNTSDMDKMVDSMFNL